MLARCGEGRRTRGAMMDDDDAPGGIGGLTAHFMRERPMLLRMMRARLGSHEEAEDVLQEVWMKVASGQSGPIAQPVAYLFRIASNVALDRRRAALRRSRREQDWSDLQDEAGERPSAERAMIQSERLAQVDAAVAALPPRTAAIFRQFRYEAVPRKTIADLNGISVSAVEKHLTTAYRALHGLRDDVGDGAVTRGAGVKA